MNRRRHRTAAVALATCLALTGCEAIIRGNVNSARSAAAVGALAESAVLDDAAAARAAAMCAAGTATPLPDPADAYGMESAAALDEFRQAARERPGFRAHAGMASAHEARGDIELAVQEWLRVVDARGEILRDGFPPDWVLAHLALSRLFAKALDGERARAHAKTFLDIWRDADAPALRAEAERLVQ